MAKVKTVLVIDDDESFVDLLAMLLRSHGYNAITTQDALHGLELAEQNKPDLIILDVTMPILNGLGVLAQLRATEATHLIPTLMMSSSDPKTYAEKSLQLGANGYLPKDDISATLPKTVASFI